MRIMFKILAAPFVVVLSVLWAVLAFVFGVLEGILGYITGFVALAAIAMFVFGNTSGAIAFGVVAFLVSPVGVPLVADWLVELVAALNDSLKDFIMA